MLLLLFPNLSTSVLFRLRLKVRFNIINFLEIGIIHYFRAFVETIKEREKFVQTS